MNTLGEFLRELRVTQGYTLRQVEELTQREVSNSYLSQLERNAVNPPSPHILYELSKVYNIAYEILMEKAGYLMRENEDERNIAFLGLPNDITEEEMLELRRYLEFLRDKPK